MTRSFKDYFIISLKGLAMGAADVVPGVSGGTIAFISGIYNELIDSINSIGFKTLKILKQDGFKAMFKSVNGNFLLSLFIGIGISVVSLAKVLKFLLDKHTILLWSFFFGLVLASILYIVKQITKWNVLTILFLLIGIGIAYYITIIPPMNGSNSSLFLIFAGALAICAMILPGISGALILLLLGAYEPAIDAINNYDFKKIFLLGLGAIIGLLSFAKILKWLFDKYNNLTLAVLTGFVIGSLNKIWPWKETISTFINSHGETKPLFQKSISPFVNTGDFGNENKIILAIILAILGFAVIFILEKVGDKFKTN
jgi:putative membrane protein